MNFFLPNTIHQLNYIMQHKPPPYAHLKPTCYDTLGFLFYFTLFQQMVFNKISYVQHIYTYREREREKWRGRSLVLCFHNELYELKMICFVNF